MAAIDELRALKTKEDPQALKRWINNAISPNTSEKGLGELIMKLQLVSQDIDSSLDRLSEQLTQAIPGFWQVLTELNNESQGLRNDLKTTRKDVHKMSERNQNVMGVLSEVHSVKNKMAMCVDSLSEIHNWEARIQKIKKLFEERLAQKTKNKLAISRTHPTLFIGRSTK